MKRSALFASSMFLNVSYGDFLSEYKSTRKNAICVRTCLTDSTRLGLGLFLLRTYAVRYSFWIMFFQLGIVPSTQLGTGRTLPWRHFWCSSQSKISEDFAIGTSNNALKIEGCGSVEKNIRKPTVLGVGTVSCWSRLVASGACYGAHRGGDLWPAVL